MRLACCSYETSPQSGTAGGMERSAPRRGALRAGMLQRRNTTIRAASLRERAARVERKKERKRESKRDDGARGKKGIGRADRLVLGSASSRWNCS